MMSIKEDSFSAFWSFSFPFAKREACNERSDHSVPAGRFALSQKTHYSSAVSSLIKSQSQGFKKAKEGFEVKKFFKL